MKTGLLLTAATGLTTAVLRLLDAAPLADLVAMAYLTSATMTFSPRGALARTRSEPFVSSPALPMVD